MCKRVFPLLKNFVTLTTRGRTATIRLDWHWYRYHVKQNNDKETKALPVKRASSLIFQAIFAAAALLAASVIHAQSTPALQNIYGRSHVSLNGRWHYLVDPYETGFYDYSRNAFDEQPNGRGFYEDRKQKDKGDRVEYSPSSCCRISGSSR